MSMIDFVFHYWQSTKEKIENAVKKKQRRMVQKRKQYTIQPMSSEVEHQKKWASYNVEYRKNEFKKAKWCPSQYYMPEVMMKNRWEIMKFCKERWHKLCMDKNGENQRKGKIEFIIWGSFGFFIYFLFLSTLFW